MYLALPFMPRMRSHTRACARACQHTHECACVDTLVCFYAHAPTPQTPCPSTTGRCSPCFEPRLDVEHDAGLRHSCSTGLAHWTRRRRAPAHHSSVTQHGIVFAALDRCIFRDTCFTGSTQKSIVDVFARMEEWDRTFSTSSTIPDASIYTHVVLPAADMKCFCGEVGETTIEDQRFTWINYCIAATNAIMRVPSAVSPINCMIIDAFDELTRNQAGRLNGVDSCGTDDDQYTNQHMCPHDTSMNVFILS